jgi:hypothetical protein
MAGWDYLLAEFSGVPPEPGTENACSQEYRSCPLSLDPPIDRLAHIHLHAAIEHGRDRIIAVRLETETA